MAKKPTNAGKTTYTNSGFTSFDNTLSSLRLLFNNSRASFAISPILKDMIGKSPVKGEPMYDHDNNVLFFMTAELAQDLKTVINRIKHIIETNPEELDVIQYFEAVGSGGNSRSIRVYTPGSLKLRLNGKKVSFDDNFVLRFTQEAADSGEDETIYHQIAMSSYEITTKENEVISETYDIGFDLLLEMLDAILEMNMSVPYHTARLTANLSSQGGGNAGRSKRRSSVMSEVDDDDDDSAENDGEDDSETTTRSTRRVSRSGRGASTNGGGSTRGGRSARKSLSENFNDDDDDSAGNDNDSDDTSHEDEEKSSGSTRVTRARRNTASKSLADQFADDDEAQDDIPV